jgi:hypothetical protein
MLAHWFERGGPMMFGITALLLPLLVVCGIYVVARPRWALLVGGGLAVVALAFGSIGYHESSSRTDEAMDRITREGKTSADELAEMRARGDAEARVPLVYGACVAGGATLLLALGQRRRRRG